MRFQLPNANVTNFTSDWKDGKILASLITVLKPSALPFIRPHEPLPLTSLCIDSAGWMLRSSGMMIIVEGDDRSW